MNPLDVMKYGNLTLQSTIKDLPEDKWLVGGACGWWSVKDIIAHLTSCECMLEEVLGGFLGKTAHPYMDEHSKDGMKFNDNQVALRKDHSVQQVLGEYNAVHQRVMDLARQIPAETFAKVGTLPWYGQEYALDDYIVYAFYGHKREHGAQINVYRDTLKPEK